VNRKWLPIVAFGLLIVSLLFIGVSVASGTNLGLHWHVIAGGGGRSTSSNFVIDGSIGQSAVGLLSDSNYVLGGGFWYGVGSAPTVVTGPYKLYLPVVLKA